jgi:transcriptional regulator with XRE-family HTH domain
MMKSKSPISSRAATFGPSSLRLDPDTSYAEWRRIGAGLASIVRGAQWWLGDWLNFGEPRYGAKYTEAIEHTGLERGTLANIAWVASAVPPSRRRDALPWSHHQEVAPLSPDEQDRILDSAESEGWTRAQLREAIRGRAIQPPRDDSPINAAIANQLQRIRAIAGATQRDVAEEVLGSPVMQSSWSRWERGIVRPNIATLERIAEWADVPVASFGLHGEGSAPAAAIRETVTAALDALDTGDVDAARAVLADLVAALG